MKNKYIEDDGMLWIDMPCEHEDGWNDTVTPVFASRESLLRALAECDEEYAGGNFLDNYRNAVIKAADSLIKNYNDSDIDKLLKEADSDDLEEAYDDITWLLFYYQDYLVMSMKDKEIFDEVADYMIPNYPVKRDKEFKFVEECTNEFYWFINTDERSLLRESVFKNLTDDEIKSYNKAIEDYDKDETGVSGHTLQKLQILSSVRLAHKVKDKGLE